MSLQKKVKGYIFKSKHWDVDGEYYAEFMEGNADRAAAHVYTMQEIKDLWTDGWGGKAEGKWIIVYE